MKGLIADNPTNSRCINGLQYDQRLCLMILFGIVRQRRFCIIRSFRKKIVFPKVSKGTCFANIYSEGDVGTGMRRCYDECSQDIDELVRIALVGGA
ncbi:hypothetical protein [Lacticaseibacillus manihotivorans]|uniref:hypothetical protein n=1 Tax=Lacticaseibacillus manihotivorans TaxID=88233 RepID=UPI001FB42EE9|nr:hypothetical protein [Lacticaseibacillus manihotivorans]